MYNLRTEINEIIKRLSPHTRESIFGHQDSYTTVINESDMAKIYQDIEIYAQKLDKNIREALVNHPSIAHPE